MPGFQSTRLATEGALEPFFFLYTDDSIQGNPETCKQSSIMLNYEVKNIQNLTLEEMNQMSTTLNDEHWLNLITQCRASGLTDRQWCIENGIPFF